MEIETAIDRSFFLAFEAAAVAIAALVPHTLVAADKVMTRGLLPIFKTFIPNYHINNITIVVTIHAIPKP